MPVTADDVGDLHSTVIYHYCQMIGGETGLLEDDRVSAQMILVRHLALDHVFDDRVPRPLHLQSDAMLATFGSQCSAFLLVESFALAIVFRRQPTGTHDFAALLDLLRCTVAAVGLPCSQEFVHLFLVLREPLRLYVRTIWPPDIRALVPVNAQPLQPAIDDIECFRSGAQFVSVFDAQDYCPAILPGE